MLRRLLPVFAAPGLTACADMLPDSVQDRIVRSAAEARFEINANVTPHLRVFMCGASSPFAVPNRAQACVAVIAGEDIYIVDSGNGSTNNLLIEQLDLSRIRGLLITHIHSDHIAEIPDLNLQSWVSGNPSRLQVYGPPGIEGVIVGLNQAYSLESRYRAAHTGEEFLPLDKVVMEPRVIDTDSNRVLNPVIEDDELTISAIAVDHSPVEHAFAYRFDYGDDSVVISGDTVAVDVMVEAAADADILFHEAMSLDLMRLMEHGAVASGNDRWVTLLQDVLEYHAPTTDVARIANDANVGKLVFYHPVPPPANSLLRSIFMRGVDDIRDDVEIAEDRQWFEVGD